MHTETRAHANPRLIIDARASSSRFRSAAAAVAMPLASESPSEASAEASRIYENEAGSSGTGINSELGRIPAPLRGSPWP